MNCKTQYGLYLSSKPRSTEIDTYLYMGPLNNSSIISNEEADLGVVELCGGMKPNDWVYGWFFFQDRNNSNVYKSQNKLSEYRCNLDR